MKPFRIQKEVYIYCKRVEATNGGCRRVLNQRNEHSWLWMCADVTYLKRKTKASKHLRTSATLFKFRGARET